MNDDSDYECPCSWTDKAKAIALIIGALAAAIPGTVAATMGILNNNKAQEIRTQQLANTQKLEKVVQETSTTAGEVMETKAAAKEAAAKNVEELFMKESSP